MKQKYEIWYPSQVIEAERPSLMENLVKCKIREGWDMLNKSANLKDEDPPWICKLKLLGPAALDDPEIQSLIKEAYEKKDVPFIKQHAEFLAPTKVDITAVTNDIGNMLLPGFLCDISLDGIKVQIAKVEEDIRLKAFAITVTEGLLDQTGDAVVQPF